MARKAEISSVQQGLAFGIKDFGVALKKAYPSGITDQQREGINSVMAGEASVGSLPEPMREVVANMRNHIDSLSRELIDVGAVQGDLVATVEGNMGIYWTRSYEVFDYKEKWADLVKEKHPQVYNAAIARVREIISPPSLEKMEGMKMSDVRAVGAQLGIVDPSMKKSELIEKILDINPKELEKKIQGRVDKLLFKGEEAQSPMQMISKGLLGAKNLGILKQRELVPPWLRALWGERRSPLENYVISVEKMGGMIANHKFLAGVRAENMGTLFLEPSQGPMTIGGDRFIVQVSVLANDTMAPLNGVWTTPEIHKAFQQVFSSTRFGPVMSKVLALNSVIKLSKTVLSETTHIRNFISNIAFAAQSGHIVPGGYHHGTFKKSFNLTMTKLFNLSDEEFRKEVLELQERGIIGDTARAGEMRDIARASSMHDIDTFIDVHGTKAGRLARKALKGITNIYQAEDDFWKMFGYFNERQAYADALGKSIDDPEVKAIAAEHIRNLYPTYSRVGKAVQDLRRFPLLGTFVSFPHEVVRCNYHCARLISQEMRSDNKKVRAIGARRLAGLIFNYTSTAAVATGVTMLSGWGSGQDDDLRRYLPWYAKNNQIMFLPRGKDGTIYYVDLSYTDPNAYIKAPLEALMRGLTGKEDIFKSTVEAASEMFKPFLSEEILTQALIDIRRNKNQFGKPIWNPQADLDTKTLAWMNHLYKAIEPGSITGKRRILKGLRDQTHIHGRTYHPLLETISQVTGFKTSGLNIKGAFKWKVRDWKNDLSDAKYLYTAELHREGTVGSEQLKSKFEEQEKSRRKIYEEAKKDYDAAVRLGVKEKTLHSFMKSQRLSNIQIEGIKQGKPPRFEVPKDYVEGGVGKVKSAGLGPEEVRKARKELRTRKRATEILVRDQRKRRDFVKQKPPIDDIPVGKWVGDTRGGYSPSRKKKNGNEYEPGTRTGVR